MAFHPTTVTILTYVLGEQQRDLTLYQRRLEHADKVKPKNDAERERFPRIAASFRNQVAELTAVIADLTELLRLIAQHDADAAEQDAHIAESYRADAWRCEVHVGLTDDQLAALACGSVYPAATR